tara:strand:+ start:130 stop:324 length:195 start_codon:yes stop_codon:yes gene_type:complete
MGEKLNMQHERQKHDQANLHWARIVAANLALYGPAEITSARNTFTRLGKTEELAQMKARMEGTK